MNYNKIILFNDKNINIIFKEKKYTFNPSRIAFNKGIIISRDKFINEYLNFCKKNSLLKNKWFQKNLVIYNDIGSLNDLRQIKYIFNEISYKEVNYVSIKNIVKLTKKDSYIIGEENYRIHYIDINNNKQVLNINKNILTLKEITLLLNNKLKNKNLYILSEDKNIEKIISNCNLNYFFSKKAEFLLKILENKHP